MDSEADLIGRFPDDLDVDEGGTVWFAAGVSHVGEGFGDKRKRAPRQAQDADGADGTVGAPDKQAGTCLGEGSPTEVTFGEAEVFPIPGRGEAAQAVLATSNASPSTPAAYAQSRHTDLETTLASLVVGGHRAWLHAPTEAAVGVEPWGDPEDEEEARTRAAMAAISQDTVLVARLARAPEPLALALRNILLQQRQG